MNTTVREVGALTPEVSWSVENELARVEQAFDNGEVLGVPAKCLVGFEVDYKLEAAPLAKLTDSEVHGKFGYSREQIEANRKHLETTKPQVTQELSLLTAKNDKEVARQQAWLGQVDSLALKDLVNYQIYRQLATPDLDLELDIAACLTADESPETSIEYRFGTALYQEGYYDNPGLYEARTAAAIPTIALQRHRRFVETSRQVANQYGMDFSYLGDHTNFSVWAENNGKLEPWHGLSTQERAKETSNAAGGILLALADAEVAFTDLTDRTMSEYDALKDMSAGYLRGSSLRVLPDRFEYRRTIGANGQHDLAVLALMSGFAYGVSHPEEAGQVTSVATRPLIVPAEDRGFDKRQDLHFLRGLENATIDPETGRFTLDLDFMNERGEQVFRSLVSIDHASKRIPLSMARSLLNTVSLTDTGEITYNATEFDRRLGYYKPVSAAEKANPRIAQSINAVRYAGEVNAVVGVLPELRTITWETAEGKLAQFAVSEALGHAIDSDVLGVIHDAQAPSVAAGAILKDWNDGSRAILKGTDSETLVGDLLQVVANTEANHTAAGTSAILSLVLDATQSQLQVLERSLASGWQDPSGKTQRESEALGALQLELQALLEAENLNPAV